MDFILIRNIIIICLFVYFIRKIPTTDKQDEQDSEDYDDSSISEEREIVLVKILKKETLNEEEICIAEDLLNEIIEEHRRYSNEQK